MKNTVTVCMDCPRCGTDLDWMNAACHPTCGVVALHCPRCDRDFSLHLFLRVMESTKRESVRQRTIRRMAMAS